MTEAMKHATTMEWILMGISVSIAGLSAVTAFSFYVLDPSRPAKFVSLFPRLHRFVENKLMVDEFYGAQIIQPLVNASRALWAFVDVNIIDKATFVVGDIVRGVGSTARTLQTGNLQQYALYIALGAVAVLFYVLK